jgi:hypothetical protein
LKSGTKTFANTAEVILFIEQTINQAISIIKIRLSNFIRSDPEIPHDTGFMRQTAVNHVLRTTFGLTFKITVWFDTPYAQYLDDFPQHTGWFDRIVRISKEIIQETFQNTLTRAGLSASVIIA